MSNKKYEDKELAVSRVAVMLFALGILSVLTYLYIMPFKKHSLQINNYYVYIEYAVMGVTLAAFVCAIIFARLKRTADYSQKVITPNLFLILSFSAAVSAFVIPLSSNRTLSSKYAIIAYFCLFLTYAFKYFINRNFAYQSVICSVYCIIFCLTDVFFSDNLTFNDAPAIDYSTYLTAFGGILVLAVIITYFVSKKCGDIKLWHTSSLSVIAAAAILARIFVRKYVSTIAVLALIALFIALVVSEKLIEKKSK